MNPCKLICDSCRKHDEDKDQQSYDEQDRVYHPNDLTSLR